MKIKGITTSKGIAFGTAFVLVKKHVDVSFKPCTDIDTAINELHIAIKKSKDQLKAIVKKTKEEIGEKESKIFNAHSLILDDPEYVKSIENIITKENVCVTYAVEQTRKMFEAMFLGMDNSYMRERAADINDVSNRLIRAVLNIEDSIDVPAGTILICEDLEPSDTAALDPAKIAGIITEKGGETSHSAIIAKSLAIPAISNVKMDSGNVVTGDKLILDAIEGVLIVNPTESELAHYQNIKDHFVKEQSVYKVGMLGRVKTLDGHEVEISANIASADHLKNILEQGADGVGLFRTEFLYMNRTSPPSVEEQYNAYKTALQAFGDKPMVIRTFDIGGDKRIDYLNLEEEMNPFLGYRAIRISLDRKELFKVQIKALLMASPYGNLKIMFPMISSIEELLQTREVIDSVRIEMEKENIPIGDYEIGMMVEIPAVAVQADKFAKYVDFFSIGTNDLLQYTVAVDRMNEKLTHLYSWYHPGLLEMIKMVANAGEKAGIWVGICGEAAADPNLLPFYVGIGIHELSMSPSKIAEIKWRLRHFNKSEMGEVVAHVLSLDTSEQVKRYLTTLEKNLQ
ncbi:MAG: phosphoenolpyruvate--protein phosphotransferase [Clostridia bacterium]|nr:phosphoenolpyruvate--protein phosphotransferase [Clostridia bacterium]